MAATPLGLFSRLVSFVGGILAPREPPAAETVERQLAALNAQFDTNVTRLAQGLANNTVSLGQFDGAMRSAIRQHHLAVAVVAQGGTQNATPQTLALAQGQVNVQMGYFDAWMRELQQQAAAGELPSVNYIANRARMYGKAAKATAERASVQGGGLPDLPFHPAEKTPCKFNCKCRWNIRVIDAVNGSYDCYYRLGDAEHCSVCVARARAANPLRVRRGQIVNAEKYQAAHLYA